MTSDPKGQGYTKVTPKPPRMRREDNFQPNPNYSSLKHSEGRNYSDHYSGREGILQNQNYVEVKSQGQSEGERSRPLSCLHGLKVMSMMWVIVGNTYYFTAKMPSK